MNDPRTSDRMRIEDLVKRCSCATECDQRFCDETDDQRVIVQFQMVRDRAGRWRRMDVSAVFQPGIDGAQDGTCEISILYNLESRRVENVYAAGQNIDTRRLPALLQVYYAHLEGRDARYHPFQEPLRAGSILSDDLSADSCSKPN